MRISPVCLLCALFALVVRTEPASTQGVPVRNIQLTEASDIADASAVNRAISVLVKDVGSCSPTAQGSQSCACSFKDDLKKLKATYDAAVAKHPPWNEADTVVVYTDPADGKSVAVVFPNVKRQLDACSPR
jgi:hypothetical protein